MTADRRPLLLSAAAAFLLPACISIHAKTTPITPPDAAKDAVVKTTEPPRKTEFGIFPSRPGDVVATKPDAKGVTTAQKTGNPVPPGPPGGVTVAGDPGPFPIAPTRPTLPPEPPLLAAVRAYAEGKPERAIEYIAALDRPNQEFVLAVLPALVRGATADLTGDPVGIAVLVDQLHSAAQRLEPFAALRVDTVAFCEAVIAFGRYSPWPVNKPYRPNDQVQLYLEVRNLVSEPTVGPRGETYVTRAQVAVEIRDAYNRLVEQPDAQRRVPVVRYEKKLYTRAPVHDFHVLYSFPAPATPGVYTITVELRDASGRRVVKTAPARFDVAGP
jgi:hypothetical protein